MLKAGEIAPDFALPDADGSLVSLSSMRGQWVVLYFYPRDMTSGCTMEALEFTVLKAGFDAAGAVVVGVSADSEASHFRFREKNALKNTLLSDGEKKTIVAYGAWQTKKMYGRESEGTVRSTYLIAPDGKIAYVWPKVRAVGHADAVLAKLKELVE